MVVGIAPRRANQQPRPDACLVVTFIFGPLDGGRMIPFKIQAKTNNAPLILCYTKQATRFKAKAPQTVLGGTLQWQQA